MQTKSKNHWDGVYHTKSHAEVSWYKPHLDSSLQLISQIGLSPNDRIIDIGAGSSTLVDDLLARGFKDITVLDISSDAIRAAKSRLGKRASSVWWIETDITHATLPDRLYDVWHDRALFHFLTRPEDRRKYVDVLCRFLKPGGHLIMAAFSLNGPPMCSGLDVVRYSPESLRAELGKSFTLVETFNEEHLTPSGGKQAFVYCRFARRMNN